MVKWWALSKPGFHSDLRKLNLLIGNKTVKEGVRFAMLSHQKPRILWLAPQKAKNYPPSKKWDFSLVDLKMVKEEGLVVVGERHTKETVIQDCNSYIKVILLSILEATNIIKDVFTISSSQMNTNIKRSVSKTANTSSDESSRPSYFRIVISLSFDARPTKMAREQWFFFATIEGRLKTFQ